jgi:phage protein D
VGLGVAIAVGGVTDAELGAATLVEVHERAGAPTTFRLRFEADIGQGDLPQLVDPRRGPGSVLSVLLPLGGVTHCLVKGPVHGQRVHLEHGGDGSYFEVKGADRSSEMDREARSEVWDGVVDSDVVSTIATRYGFQADVEATPATRAEAKHTLVQRASDLRFVQRLARRNGSLFWISADGAGVETAHFRRPPLGGSPSATLEINRANPGVNALDLRWDVERPTSFEARQLELESKGDIDGSVSQSPLTALAAKDLAAITADTRSALLDLPADEAGDLRARSEGALIDASWFVRATCEARLDAVGALVRAHSVVELKGAGSRHSGRYFVASVRHTIDATQHRMELELTRNAWEA